MIKEKKGIEKIANVTSTMGLGMTVLGAGLLCWELFDPSPSKKELTQNVYNYYHLGISGLVVLTVGVSVQAVCKLNQLYQSRRQDKNRVYKI